MVKVELYRARIIQQHLVENFFIDIIYYKHNKLFYYKIKAPVAQLDRATAF